MREKSSLLDLRSRRKLSGSQEKMFVRNTARQLLRAPARSFGSEAAIPTALYDLHASLKGKMVPFAGEMASGA